MSKRSSRITSKEDDDLGIMSKRSRTTSNEDDDLGIMSKRSRITSKEDDDLGIMSKRSRITSKEDDDLGIMSKRSRITSNQDDDDVVPVELIHLIQSLLPLKEGGRTCILSKSWLRAWYTLPTLKLIPPEAEHTTWSLPTHENETKYNKLIHTTLQRYHINNTPIQSFHLLLTIISKKTLEDVQNSIRLVVSKTCLQELSLDIAVYRDDDLSLTLPNELFSSQGLHTIHVKSEEDVRNLRLRISSTNVINCVSLRVLDLDCVFINQDVFNTLLSTCSLLEKIRVNCCGGLNNVKVQNLVRLTELDIYSIEHDDLWEINNVPSLCSFRYRHLFAHMKPIPFQMDSLSSVTQLCIEGDLIFDNSFFDTLESKFPVLESLTLSINHWELKNMAFTSASLMWLTLNLNTIPTIPAVNVQVYAPKLVSFIYAGKIPGLLFQTTAPKQVKLTFDSWGEPLGHSYFLKIREALNLSSSKFDINITRAHLDSVVRCLNIDVDDLRRRVLLSPVKNVQLELETRLDEHTWEQSRFFDAFFLICHPSYIRSRYQVIRNMMEAAGNTTDQLKEVLLKNPYTGIWKPLTSSWISFLHKFPGDLECKVQTNLVFSIEHVSRSDDNVKAKIQDKMDVPLQKESTLPPCPTSLWW